MERKWKKFPTTRKKNDLKTYLINENKTDFINDQNETYFRDIFLFELEVERISDVFEFLLYVIVGGRWGSLHGAVLHPFLKLGVGEVLVADKLEPKDPLLSAVSQFQTLSQRKKETVLSPFRGIKMWEMEPKITKLRREKLLAETIEWIPRVEILQRNVVSICWILYKRSD